MLETHPVTAVLTTERVSFMKIITVFKPVLGVILQNVEKLLNILIFTLALVRGTQHFVETVFSFSSTFNQI